MNIDHVVLWVNKPKQSLAFYCDMLGMRPLRAEEYESGHAPFPSVRLNDETIFDLMDKNMLAATSEMTGGMAGGHPINHVCLNMEVDAYLATRTRLDKHGITLNPGPTPSFGAQGFTADSGYFQDPDGNIIEIRCYRESTK